MENILLEASQRQSNSNTNGSYDTIFSKAHYVYEGDEIILSKIFIDTESATDGIVVIDNPTTINGSVCLYSTNNDVTKNFSYVGQAIEDAEDYYASEVIQTNHPNYNNMIHIKRLRVNGNSNGKASWGDETKGVRPISIKFLDIVGKAEHFFLEIPFFPTNSGESFTEIAVSIFCQRDTLSVDNVNSNWDFNNIEKVIQDFNQPTIEGAGIVVINGDVDSSPTFTRRIINPMKFDFSITIDEGKYLPVDLCFVINDQLARNGVANNFVGGLQVVSPFFQNTAQVLAQTNPASVPQYVSKFGAPNDNVFTMNDNKWVGASLISLEFDTTDNKFYWNYAHQPFYFNGAISTQIKVAQGIGNFINQRKNGGIAFVTFDSNETITNADGTTRTIATNFVEDVLGFKKHNFLVTPKFRQEFNIGGQVFHAQQIESIDGVNTTNAKADLDMGVDKTTFMNVPTGNVVYNGITSTINVIIKADTQTVSGNLLSSGYYLVQVDGIFKNYLYDYNGLRTNISAIASRYYSLGSYTATEGDFTMSYTHKGEPVILSSISVNILNPDKTLAKVGNDNTIFIYINRGELAKNLGQIEAQELTSKKQK